MYKTHPYILYSLLILCITWSPVNYAGTFACFEFKNQEQEQRYKDLIAELRCLVCQNQSLADSDAGLAKDLRQEVYDKMQQGKDNQEITDFLVARYGDFVLYRPPMKLSTSLLWLAPIAFIFIAIIVILKNVTKSRKDSPPSLDTEERAKISQLLDQNDRNDRNDKDDKA